MEALQDPDNSDNSESGDLEVKEDAAEDEPAKELRHLISAGDLTRHELENLLAVAEMLIDHPRSIRFARNRIRDGEPDGVSVIYNFVEPSTRTRVSFITAAQLLGLNVEGTENAKVSSSSAKKETIEDGIITLSQYASKFGAAAIVLRDSIEGAAERAAAVSDVSIVNAGDGPGEHPSQSILDELTTRRRRGELSNRTFIYPGDVRNSRTIHSKVQLELLYSNNRFVFATPPELALDERTRALLDEAGANYDEVPTLSAALELTAGSARDIYFVRDQEERRTAEIAKLRKYELVKRFSLMLADRRIKRSYVRDFGLTEEILANQITEDDAIYHPRPSGGEIAILKRDDPRNATWEQVSNGVEARMAILMWVMRVGLFKNGDYVTEKLVAEAEDTESEMNTK